MLTQEEKDFMEYWEKNRAKRKKVFRQFLLGIPIALLFTIPIYLNFSSGWGLRAHMEANSWVANPIVLILALVGIIVFVAIFHQQHKWDQYDQRYQELSARKSEEDPKF